MKSRFYAIQGGSNLSIMYIGKFSGIGEAIEYGDSILENVIWYLDEEDAENLIKSFIKQRLLDNPRYPLKEN